MAHVIIPAGWYRLPNGVMATREDFCINTERTEYQNGHALIKEWERCHGLANSPVGTYPEYIVIRQGATPEQPAQEKEWLNPWD